jgi:biopolymer transport protein TolR
VLLVIFMITAPLLTKGVEVDLPNTSAEPVPQNPNEPIVLTVDRDGKYYLNIGDAPDQPIANDKLKKLVSIVLKKRPETAVLVRGDGKAEYQQIITAMSVLKSAGVPKVGLVTEPDES